MTHTYTIYYWNDLQMAVVLKVGVTLNAIDGVEAKVSLNPIHSYYNNGNTFQ